MVAALILILAGVMLTGPVMSDVEQPRYSVISQYENIEVRAYDPMIIAEVSVTSAMAFVCLLIIFLAITKSKMTSP